MQSGLRLIHRGRLCSQNGNLIRRRQRHSPVAHFSCLSNPLSLDQHGVERKSNSATAATAPYAAANSSCLSMTRKRHGRTFSSSSRYAVVDHSEAYENAMRGPHGQQLALARLEGVGKDEPPFDPFLEDELEQDALDNDDDDTDDEGREEKDYGDDIQEAEYVDEDGAGDDSVEEDDEYYSNEDDYEDADESIYNNDGSVKRKKSVLATLRAGFPSGGLFAVVELAGNQHKVTTDDLLVVNRLKPVDKYKIGSTHTLKDVLLVSSSHKTLVGLPTVSGAEVDVMVEEITRDAKVIVFKKRRRKHSQRKNGFRRDITLLRVLDIRMPDADKDHDHVGRDMLDELENATDAVSRSSTKPAAASSTEDVAAEDNPSKRQEVA